MYTVVDNTDEDHGHFKIPQFTVKNLKKFGRSKKSYKVCQSFGGSEPMSAIGEEQKESRLTNYLNYSLSREKEETKRSVITTKSKFGGATARDRVNKTIYIGKSPLGTRSPTRKVLNKSKASIAQKSKQVTKEMKKKITRSFFN